MRFLLVLFLLLTGCSNAQYQTPAVTGGKWYGEVSGFNIEWDLVLFEIETPAVHLYINVKTPYGGFENFQKLMSENSDGTHYFAEVGYIGYRNTEAPLLVLTEAQALAVYKVASSVWAQNLAKEYRLIGFNSNRFVVKILERAGVAFDPPTGAIQ